jgi:hypothetical protein
LVIDSLKCPIGHAVGAAIAAAPTAHTAPAPEIEYLYNVEARRHFNFPANTDPVGYGRSICDKVGSGESLIRGRQL